MTESTLAIPGFTIGYKTWGSKDLPPMLALHGWLDNANSFHLLAPYLENHFHVIAIDFPGHGYSSHLPEGCFYHFSDGIFNVLQIIRGFGFEKIHLLGHSMGACLASLIAGVVPEQILSLRLIEGLGPFSHPESSCRSQLSRYAKTLEDEQNKRAKPYLSLEQAALVRAEKGYLSKQFAEIIARRGLKKKESHYFWRHDRRLLNANPLAMTEGQVLSCLEGIKANSCLIWASKGYGFDKEILQYRIKVVKNLKVFSLEGGHHIHMEQPKEVAKILRSI